MNILLDVARVLPTQKTPHREFHTENWWVYGPRSLLVHWNCLSSHTGGGHGLQRDRLHDRTQVTTIPRHTQSSDQVEGQMGGEALLTW